MPYQDLFTALNAAAGYAEMSPKKQFIRLVLHCSKEKQEEFKDMSAEAKLRWLENANKLLYAAYVSSGRKEPYDPQSWPYLT